MEKQNEYKNIDKAIYQLPEISKRLRPVWWAWACVAVGVSGLLLNQNLHSIGAGLSSFLAGMIVTGLFGAATIVCYYLFGDCRAPYHKPLHKLLSREYFYYSKNESDELASRFEAKDMASIDKIKKSAAPHYTLVRYSDKDENVFYAQIFENTAGKDVPVTDVVKMENK